MKKLIALAFLATAAVQAANITGWVAAVTPAGYTRPYYTVPDADYDHFIATVIQPLVNFDETWAKLGLFDRETYWQTFDCHCSTYDPSHPIDSGMGGGNGNGGGNGHNGGEAPEPATWIALGSALLVMGLWRAAEVVKVGREDGEEESEF